ncbi:MAG: flavodoxin family protein [Desulfurococcales archaeon]|nr:flavodoxin family protein [Desulfurococcales archaeon]
MYKVLGICGSPRIGGNTEILLGRCLEELERLGAKIEFLRLSSLRISPCTSCRKCLELGECCIHDDMCSIVVPKLLEADIIVVASPVYFNNVSSYVKVFIDRTWCIRGRLKNKVGGGIVVGRGYGLELALTTIHAFMLKHSMILGHRGVSAQGFEKGEVLRDKRALKDTIELANRLYELASMAKHL